MFMPATQTITYLDTAVKMIQKFKPGQPVNNYLNYVGGMPGMAPQAKGFIQSSNLPCFKPIITLQSEIDGGLGL